MQQSSAAARERERVRGHLAGAERLARGRSPALDPLRAFNRALLLDELGRYRRRGRFPLRHDNRQALTPQFIDVHGTRCAMAHLLEISGQAELVAQIAKTDNAARVQRLARFPELGAWLAAAGLSLDEAARIQPSYCGNPIETCFCADSGQSGVAVGTITEIGAGLVHVRVDRIEGDFPGLSLGTLLSVPGSGEVGAQVLLPRQPVGTAPMKSIGSEMSITADTVTCPFYANSAVHPLSLDAVLTALQRDDAGCIHFLQATADPSYSDDICDDSGCSFTPVSPAASAGLTAAALFVALIRYRRRPRR